MGKQLPNALRNSQLRSADQFILQGWRHIHKVGTVAGYTDNQIFIFHRLSFGGYQGILVHHIELHMPQFQIAPGTNKGKQTLRPLFSGYHTRRQLEIQQAGRPLLIAFIFLRSDCFRTVRSAGAFRQIFARFSSVGGGPGYFPARDMEGNRHNAHRINFIMQPWIVGQVLTDKAVDFFSDLICCSTSYPSKLASKAFTSSSIVAALSS